MELPPSPTQALAGAHRRFAREALLIQGGAGLMALALLGTGLLADLRTDQAAAHDQLELETVLRARMVDAQLAAMAEELDRLALRAEVDPGDANAGPERLLLDASHDASTTFDLGVAVLDAGGRVLASEPSAPGRVDVPPWLAALGPLPDVDRAEIRPLRTGTHGVALLRPLVRNGSRSGTLVAATLLPDELALAPRQQAAWHLVDGSGLRILPAPPTAGAVPEVLPDDLVVVSAPLPGRDLALLGEAERSALYAPAWERFRWRLVLGLGVLGLPLALLVARFARSLTVLRATQDAAVEDAQLRMMGTAANAVAHEVRNALNGIRMGIDLLGNVGEARRERVQEQLRREVARLVDFTGGLMQFARQPEVRPEPVDVVAVAREVVAFHGELAAELGVDVDLDAPATAIVPGDRTLLRMAVENLVRNAMDALSTRARGRVRVEVVRAGGRVRLRVADDGPGVPDELVVRIFDPFVTGRESGVGLGLSLVRQVVAAHRGEVRYEGRGPLGGASFVLDLPGEAT